MSTADPNPPLHTPSSGEPSTAPNAPDTPAESRLFPTPGSPRRSVIWFLALAAALMAGVATWLAGETDLLQIPAEKVMVNTMGGPMLDTTAQTLTVADEKTAVRVFGVFGSAMGLALGLAGGLAGHSPRRAGIAAGVGLVVGGLVGALAPLVVLPIFERAGGAGSNDMTPALLMHAGVWMGVGAAGGLAFGIGLGGSRRVVASLIGGAVGAAIGAVAYDFIGAIAFPLAGTASPISTTWGSRLLARLLVVAFTAVGIALAVSDPRKASAPIPPAR